MLIHRFKWIAFLAIFAFITAASAPLVGLAPPAGNQEQAAAAQSPAAGESPAGQLRVEEHHFLSWAVALVVALLAALAAMTLRQARGVDETGKKTLTITVGTRIIANASLVLILVALMAALTAVSTLELDEKLSQVGQLKKLTESVTAIEQLHLMQGVWLQIGLAHIDDPSEQARVAEALEAVANLDERAETVERQAARDFEELRRRPFRRSSMPPKRKGSQPTWKAFTNCSTVSMKSKRRRSPRSKAETRPKFRISNS